MRLEPSLINWGISALLFILALAVLIPSLRALLSERREERRINGLGHSGVRRVWLDDGMDGKVFIDYLLLTETGILLANLNRREGILFAGERMDSWAQVIGRKTYHFPNPLRELEALVASLRQQFPKITIDYRLVFTNPCSFPKGKPEGIELLGELPLPPGKADAPAASAPPLAEAWKQLSGSAEPVSAQSAATLLEERPAYGRRLGLALILMAAAGGWPFLGPQLLG